MTNLDTRITLIRHGHVHNPDNLIYGRLPGFHLSEVGFQQAAAAAAALRGAPLAALYCSPQLRAQQTASRVRSLQSHLDVTTEPRIDETDCYFEGHLADEVEARGWDLYTGVPDGYETPVDIAERASSFLIDARTRHAGSHIAAVSHGDIIAFLILWAMQQPADVSLKRTLNRYGVTDTYPATASLTTLTYSTASLAEVPRLSYVRPYGEELTVVALS